MRDVDGSCIILPPRLQLYCNPASFVSLLFFIVYCESVKRVLIAFSDKRVLRSETIEKKSQTHQGSNPQTKEGKLDDLSVRQEAQHNLG